LVAASTLSPLNPPYLRFYTSISSVCTYTYPPPLTAYFFTSPAQKLITPSGLRAPKLVLTGTVNATLDIWSFGCLIFELVTGTPLFCIPGGGCSSSSSHLLDLTARIGPLPDELFRHWKTSSLYFTPERELYNCQLGGVPEGKEGEPLMIEQTTMEELFDQAGPEIGENEAIQIKALIRRILRYKPAERPSARELLADPWFGE
jgi:serine/threonine protein kinase